MEDDKRAQDLLCKIRKDDLSSSVCKALYEDLVHINSPGSIELFKGIWSEFLDTDHVIKFLHVRDIDRNKVSEMSEVQVEVVIGESDLWIEKDKVSNYLVSVISDISKDIAREIGNLISCGPITIVRATGDHSYNNLYPMTTHFFIDQPNRTHKFIAKLKVIPSGALNESD